MPVTLRRYIETTQGTLGQFTLSGGETFYTIERMSTGEHPRIPAGMYEMRLDYYHKGDYPAYLILVPGRQRILIHAANRAVELLGCIAPGQTIGFLGDQLAVLQSRAALAQFMVAMKNVPADYITVLNPPL